jgi:hypothetical protein
MEEQIGKYLVQTSMHSSGMGNIPVISTSVFTGEDYQLPCYMSDIYRTQDKARRGHCKIARDVENNPDKYSAEKYFELLQNRIKNSK